MADLDFLVFDADNHYYEAEDAFTRHVDRRMQARCTQWAEIKGRKRASRCATDYVRELEGFSDAEVRQLMRESAMGLSERRLASAA